MYERPTKTKETRDEVTTDLGSGEVTIDGDTQRWDSMKLLDSGVLRLAQLDTWSDEGTGLVCAADRSVQYLSLIHI